MELTSPNCAAFAPFSAGKLTSVGGRVAVAVGAMVGVGGSVVGSIVAADCGGSGVGAAGAAHAAPINETKTVIKTCRGKTLVIHALYLRNSIRISPSSRI